MDRRAVVLAAKTKTPTSSQQPTKWLEKFSTFDAFTIQRKDCDIEWPFHVIYGYTLSTVQSAPGAFLISSRPGRRSLLQFPFVPVGSQNELTVLMAIS